MTSKTDSKPNVIASGLAMFSMFFGAGNVVFPLTLGQFSKDQNLFAILGLLITAVCVPFLGLMAMSLFDGDYKKFFGRIGKVPGFLVALLIMGLIGPFGALPRCIALSYSTTKMFFPTLDIQIFSFLSCLLIFLLTFRKNNIIDILGYFLTPLLLGSLAIIMIKGIFFAPGELPISSATPSESFIHGLKEGYQTMDLLGAFFFSSVVIASLKQGFKSDEFSHQNMLSQVFKAVLVGAPLLALTYVGFSYVAAYNSESLAAVGTDQLLGQIALIVLGPWAGIVACVAVALACLTTAIALACVFSEFLHYDVTLGKIGYIPSLIITLVVSYFISVMNFSEIVKFLQPILQILYPSLIALSVLNLLYKLYRFEPVVVPVGIILILTLGDWILF